jgi:hypothetical protein
MSWNNLDPQTALDLIKSPTTRTNLVGAWKFVNPRQTIICRFFPNGRTAGELHYTKSTDRWHIVQPAFSTKSGVPYFFITDKGDHRWKTSFSCLESAKKVIDRMLKQAGFVLHD